LLVCLAGNPVEAGLQPGEAVQIGIREVDYGIVAFADAPSGDQVDGAENETGLVEHRANRVRVGLILTISA
jgi:hypothetical protein